MTQVPANPKFRPIKLEPCCQESLRQIRDTVKRGNILAAMAATAGLFNIITDDIVPDMVVSVATTDWSSFATAAKAAAPVAKHACELISFDEYQKHPGGPLNDFWGRAWESFSS